MIDAVMRRLLHHRFGVIRHAESRITYLTGRVDELKADNAKLKKANKVMEARVMGQSQE